MSTPEQQTGTNYAGWAADPATLTRIAERWQKIADLCADGYSDSEILVSIVPPGNEAASKYMADKANASGSAYRSALRSLRIYAQEQADNCKKANHTYQKGDDEAKIGITRSVSSHSQGSK